MNSREQKKRKSFQEIKNGKFQIFRLVANILILIRKRFFEINLLGL